MVRGPLRKLGFGRDNQKIPRFPSLSHPRRFFMNYPGEHDGLAIQG